MSNPPTGRSYSASPARHQAAKLDAIEDQIDVIAAKKSLKEEGSIPWAGVKKRLRPGSR